MSAFACASHLLVDLPLFGGPVLMLVGAVVFAARGERRRSAGPKRGAAAEGP